MAMHASGLGERVDPSRVLLGLSVAARHEARQGLRTRIRRRRPQGVGRMARFSPSHCQSGVTMPIGWRALSSHPQADRARHAGHVQDPRYAVSRRSDEDVITRWSAPTGTTRRRPTSSARSLPSRIAVVRARPRRDADVREPGAGSARGRPCRGAGGPHPARGDPPRRPLRRLRRGGGAARGLRPDAHRVRLPNGAVGGVGSRGTPPTCSTTPPSPGSSSTSSMSPCTTSPTTPCA